MTTVKEVFDQFDVPDRYTDLVEGIDIGNYTFTDVHDSQDGYYTEFTSSENPNVILRIVHDRAIVTLFKILDKENVDVTSWRYGDKVNKVFPRKMFQI